MRLNPKTSVATNLKILVAFYDSIEKTKVSNFSVMVSPPPKETVTAIIMLNKNMTAMVRSPDGDTDFFNIVARVLQGETLVPYLFIPFTNPCTATYLPSQKPSK